MNVLAAQIDMEGIYYFEPEDKYYYTKQELVDAWNDTFLDIHISEPAKISDWTEEQWKTIWKKK